MNHIQWLRLRPARSSSSTAVDHRRLRIDEALQGVRRRSWRSARAVVRDARVDGAEDLDAAAARSRCRRPGCRVAGGRRGAAAGQQAERGPRRWRQSRIFKSSSLRQMAGISRPGATARARQHQRRRTGCIFDPQPRQELRVLALHEVDQPFAHAAAQVEGQRRRWPRCTARASACVRSVASVTCRLKKRPSHSGAALARCARPRRAAARAACRSRRRRRPSPAAASVCRVQFWNGFSMK